MYKKMIRNNNKTLLLVGLAIVVSLMTIGSKINSAYAAHVSISSINKYSNSDVCLIKGTVDLNTSVSEAIKGAIVEARSEVDFNGALCFAPVDIRDEGEWLFINVIGINTIPINNNWTVKDNGVWWDVVLIYSILPEIKAAVAGTKMFSSYLKIVPENIISAKSKSIIDPLIIIKAPSMPTSLIFPFQTGHYLSLIHI